MPSNIPGFVGMIDRSLPQTPGIQGAFELLTRKLKLQGGTDPRALAAIRGRVQGRVGGQLVLNRLASQEAGIKDQRNISDLNLLLGKLQIAPALTQRNSQLNRLRNRAGRTQRRIDSQGQLFRSIGSLVGMAGQGIEAFRARAAAKKAAEEG